MRALARRKEAPSKMPRYTELDIMNARKLAEELDLKGRDKFMTIPVQEAIEICNGIGAEWMPASFRALLDKMHPSIKVAAMIHDVRYQYGDGTDEDFKLANRELFENGWAIGKHNYGWYNPVRYCVWNDSRRLANICDKFGRKAYDMARLNRMMRD